MPRIKASELFAIDTKAIKHIHKQIIDDVKKAIVNGKIRRKDILPTISDVCETFGISRLTVLKAYNELQKVGLIKAENRKGYHITSEDVDRKNNVFLLFDEFTMYKRVLYNALRERIGSSGTIDIYFHHYSTTQFESLVLNSLGNYSSYVIMPWPNKNVMQVLSKTEKKHTLLLDRADTLPKQNDFSSIVQDHKNDMMRCLEKALSQIKKYRKFILVHPLYSFHPSSTIDGFNQFCKTNSINCDVYRTFDKSNILPDTAYFVVDDNELVIIVEHCMEAGYELGKHIGIISYNETPMKRIIANGISVISTDFAMMGVRAADYIMSTTSKQQIREVIPTALIMRGSL